MTKRNTKRRQSPKPVSVTIDTGHGPATFTAAHLDDVGHPADPESAERFALYVRDVTAAVKQVTDEHARVMAALDTPLGRLFVPRSRRRWKLRDIRDASRGDKRRGHTATARAVRASNRAEQDRALRERALDLRRRREMSISAIAAHLHIGRARVRGYLAE